MGRISQHHSELNEQGEGKCSCPMWDSGGPSGFCDRPAYGEPPPSPMVWHGPRQTMVRADGRYDGYVPALACPRHGGPRVRTFMDGNAWCAVLPDFTNLQESPAGFGATRDDALAELQRLTGATP